MAKRSEELGIVEKEGGLGAFRPSPVPGERIQLVLAAKSQETGEGARHAHLGHALARWHQIVGGAGRPLEL